MREFDISKHDNIYDLFINFVEEDQSLWYLLPLVHYAADCKKVVEFGTWQGQSLTAFLLAGVRRIVSVDTDISRIDREMFQDISDRMGISLDIVRGDSLDNTFTRQVGPDMIFLDTVHIYEHVYKELVLHAPYVNKYIAIHDTNYPPAHKKPPKTVERAVLDYIASTKSKWEVDFHTMEKTGLMVIKRNV